MTREDKTEVRVPSKLEPGAVLLDRDLLWNAFNVYIRIGQNGRTFIADPVESQDFREIKEGDVPDPSFRISMEGAVYIMDQLWNAGIRPSNGAGSVGELRATQDHLEDMRKISQTALKIVADWGSVAVERSGRLDLQEAVERMIRESLDNILQDYYDRVNYETPD